MITISFTGLNGVEETKQVADGTTLGSLTPTDCYGMVDDRRQPAMTVLRDGDRIEVNQTSPKQG